MFTGLLHDLEARCSAGEQIGLDPPWRLIESIETYDDLVRALAFLSEYNNLLLGHDEGSKTPLEYFQGVSGIMSYGGEEGLLFRPKSDFAKIAGAMLFAFAES